MSHETSLEHKHTELNPQIAAFMERLKKQNETWGSSLKDLFEKEGSSEVFQEALDDVVFHIAFEDPEYAANTEKLKSGRLSDSEGEELAQKQREVTNKIRHLVIAEAGISLADGGTDIDKARLAVAERLADINPEDMKSDMLLRKLGILKENEDGEAEFTYPRDLFPEGMNEKWNLYILSVQNHMQISKEVGRGERPRSDMQDADRSRRFAHNRITQDIDEVLGFKQLPDEEWDFEQTRRLVGKMREAKFVGKETRESALTSKALARGMGKVGLNVLDKLSARKEN